MSPSTKIDNRKKDNLILGKGPTQGLEYIISAEKMYSIKLKSKDSEILANSLCLGNISKDWPVYNMKKTGLNSYVYDFSVSYNMIAVDDILDIHKYLMKK